MTAADIRARAAHHGSTNRQEREQYREDHNRLLAALDAVEALADNAPKIQHMGGWSPGIVLASEIRAAISTALEGK